MYAIRFSHNDDVLGKTGVSPAMRFAFRQATGALITRMDSDDIMPPNRLFTMKKMLLENGPGHVATGAVRFFGENGVGDGFRRYADWLLVGLAAVAGFGWWRAGRQG